MSIQEATLFVIFCAEEHLKHDLEEQKSEASETSDTESSDNDDGDEEKQAQVEVKVKEKTADGKVILEKHKKDYKKEGKINKPVGNYGSCKITIFVISWSHR